MAKIYRFEFKKLDAYQEGVQHFAWIVRLVERLPRLPFKFLDQLLRTPLSILSNIGEANGRWVQPAEVEQHYRYAQGSTFEAAAHLDALAALGAIDDDEYNEREEHLAGIAAKLTGLMNRERRRSRGTASASARASNSGGAKRRRVQ